MPEDISRRSREARIWLFDFDNTLAALEREVDWAASRRELESFLRAEGIPDSVFSEFPSRNLPLYNALLLLWLKGADVENGCDVAALHGNKGAALMRRASAIIETYELRGVVGAAPLPGAPELLRALRTRGTTIAIVTSNSSRTVNHWLEQHRLPADVDSVVGRDSLLALKPAPDMINSALQLSACTPSDAVFVGDSEADFEAARHAQTGFYGIGQTAESRGRLRARGAAMVFSSPHELMVHLGMANISSSTHTLRHARDS
jgi:HAD superfamily hydrolase (TIGR01509 family)